MRKIKKELCALGSFTAFFISAGVIENMPALSFALIVVMAVMVRIGELWEV